MTRTSAIGAIHGSRDSTHQESEARCHSYRYLVGQIPEFKSEGYFVLRLVGVLLFWQCLFAVCYWTLRLLLTPVGWVLGKASDRSGEVGADDEGARDE